MKRFFGMMPSIEIEKEKTYIDNSNLKITIQAGKNGWTIIWADGGSSFKDVKKSTRENFNEAYEKAVSKIGKLSEVNSCGKNICDSCYENVNQTLIL